MIDGESSVGTPNLVLGYCHHGATRTDTAKLDRRDEFYVVDAELKINRELSRSVRSRFVEAGRDGAHHE